MNKRIKELAEESGFLECTDYPGLEQFVELIIRECADICDTSRIKYQSLRKSAMDYEEKEIYNEGIAASDHIKYKILESLIQDTQRVWS